ncbi:MAG: hypothetical protein LBS19_11335 [Clostridiales bacterium]|jgi:hypothetical protein|nr:hypothetical protein [Clostridiales bacterium]
MEISGNITWPPDFAAQLPDAEAAAEALKGELTRLGAEMPIAQAQATPVENLILALKFLGFKPSEENVQIATLLVKNGIPFTADNLRNLNRAMKLTGESKQALFLLQNNLTVNSKNAELIKAFVRSEVSVMANLKDIANTVRDLPEGPLKQVLTDILSGEESAAQTAPSEQPAALKETAAQKNAAVSANTDTTTNTNANADIANAPDTAVPAEPQETSSVNRQAAPPSAQKAEIPGNAQTAQIPGQTAAAPPNDSVIPQPAPVAENNNCTNIVETPMPAADDITEPQLTKPQTPVKDIPIEMPEEIPDEISDEILNIKDAMKPERPEQQAYANEKEAPVNKEAENSIEKAKTGLPAKFLSRYALDPEKDGKEEIDNTLNLLREALAKAGAELTKDGSQPKLRESVERLERTLDFFNDAKALLFMQIPINAPNGETDAGLYVFNHKGHKRTQRNASSALLALDLDALGHFEAYIQRSGEHVNCRFKAGEFCRKAVETSIVNLSDRLRNKGFRLEAWSFLDETEPFTPLDTEPSEDNVKKPLTGELINLDIKA